MFYNEFNEVAYNDIIKILNENNNKKIISSNIKILNNYTPIQILCLYKNDNPYTNKLLNYMIENYTGPKISLVDGIPMLNILTNSPKSIKEKQNMIISLINNGFEIRLDILFANLELSCYDNYMVKFVWDIITNTNTMIHKNITIYIDNLLACTNSKNHQELCTLISLIHSKPKSISYHFKFSTNNTNLIEAINNLIKNQQYGILITLLCFDDTQFTDTLIKCIFTHGGNNIIGKVRIHSIIRQIMANYKGIMAIIYMMYYYIVDSRCDNEIIYYIINTMDILPDIKYLESLHNICKKSNYSINMNKLKTIYEYLKNRNYNITECNSSCDNPSVNKVMLSSKYYTLMGNVVIIIKSLLESYTNYDERSKDNLVYGAFERLFELRKISDYVHMENLCCYFLNNNIKLEYIINNSRYIERCIIYNTPIILEKLLQKGMSIYDSTLNKTHITNIFNSHYYTKEDRENMFKFLISNGYLPNNKNGMHDNDGMTLTKYIFSDEQNENTPIMLQLLKSIIVTSNDYAILGSIFNIGHKSNKKEIFLEIQKLIQNKFLLLQQEEHNKREMDNIIDGISNKMNKIL